MIAGLALSMSHGDIVVRDEDFNFSLNLGPFAKSLFVVMFSVFFGLVVSLLLSQRLVKTNLFARIALNKEQDPDEGYIGVPTEQIALTGKQGIAYTILRPSGKVMVDNEIYDAKALTGYIEKGDKIEVVRYDIAQLYVKKIE